MSEFYIKQAQQALTQAGFYKARIDGDFGKKSHDALIASLSNDGFKQQPKRRFNSVTLTAGHGGGDSGAVRGKYRESDIAVFMRNAVAQYLRERGVTVYTDGDGKDNNSLRSALREVPKGDIAIEFHTNAARSPFARGAEALSTSRNAVLCQELAQTAAKVLGTKLRGNAGYVHHTQRNHSRLAYAAAGGIVFEPFFLSNKKDLNAYISKAWVLAREIADVLAPLNNGEKNEY